MIGTPTLLQKAQVRQSVNAAENDASPGEGSARILGTNRISFLTFASTNWSRAHERYARDLRKLEGLSYFDRIERWSEQDLGADYCRRFSQYYSDPGFALWSWKPYALLKMLDAIGDGDFLLYLDGGCTLPVGREREFLYDLDAIRSDFGESDAKIALTDWTFPNERIVRKEMLAAFGLESNSFFRTKFPHYQAGVLLLRKTPWCRHFVSRWYEFFRDRYEDIMHPPLHNQCQGFVHNGGDQALLQCMLFTEGIKTYSMNWFTSKYRIITRDRG